MLLFPPKPFVPQFLQPLLLELHFPAGPVLGRHLHDLRLVEGPDLVPAVLRVAVPHLERHGLGLLQTLRAKCNVVAYVAEPPVGRVVVKI